MGLNMIYGREAFLLEYYILNKRYGMEFNVNDGKVIHVSTDEKDCSAKE